MGFWKNQTVTRRRPFVARFLVAAPGANAYFTYQRERVLLGKCFEVDFVVDTGCEQTLLRAEISAQLNLKPTGGAQVQDFKGESTAGYLSSLGVLIGSNWIKLPCCFPDVGVGVDIENNFLGMKGLLKNHLLCMSRSALWIYRISCKR